MNQELRELALAAGAPEEMMDQLWFNIFCQQFANLLLILAEEEMVDISDS